ncbi:MAG: NifB/NifX family molybdenum-iron cluster-binding protein [Candidatus Nanopelagicales bacterium]
MVIAVSADRPALEGSVDPTFGRCRLLVFVDPQTMEFEAVSNPGSDEVGGAGIQAAQAVVRRGATALVTGNVGPNAMQVLQAAGITVFTGFRGSVGEGVEAYRAGALTPTASATASRHSAPGARA